MQATKPKRSGTRKDAMVRIDKHTDSTLSMLAKERNEDKKRVIAYLVERLRRDTILERFVAGISELRNDPKAWASEEAEREAWQQASLEVISDE